MPSTPDYLEYVLDLLRYVPDIHYKKMMGEYLLYQGSALFGGIYDNRFLVKDVPALEKYGFRKQIPYPTAKPMLLVDLEDPRTIAEVVEKFFRG